MRKRVPVLVIVGALVAALVRWYVQGSHNIYTALVKRFYVPDPDLGWRVSTQHPVWLGLDACAVIAVLAIATFFLVKRLRISAWLAAAGCVAVPALAFASGPGPLHGVDTLPPSSAVLVETGIEGSLDVPAGNYAVVAHEGTAITAHLSAGGEAFDARFATDITGTWRGDPHALDGDSHGEISVATASVDTGISERSKHAREGYLHADRFPRIGVTIERPIAVRSTGSRVIAFRAPATVALMGKTHAVEIIGTMQRPTADALHRLDLTGDVLLVQADLALVVRDTALAPDAHDFDGDRIPIHVSLVLRRAP